MNPIQSSTLYVVSTPIGNLNDISLRAIEILKNVDLIICEDTRVFKKIATTFSIETKCKSYHEHNEVKKSIEICDLLETGSSVALVSDAGTPTISDPGYRVINECHSRKLQVLSVPGASALIAALSISGFESHEFLFKGFLPLKSGKKKKVIQEMLDYSSTAIFYESCHRITKTLQTIASLEPDREVFVARELTKKFEETFRGSASEAKESVKAKGEFVVLIRARPYGAS